MAQHWNRNPSTGDYVMSGGAPQQTDSLTIPAFIRTRAHRTKWLYAQDKSFGSDLYKILNKATNKNPSIIESMVSRSLQPMVDDGRSDAITVTTVVRTKEGVGVQVDIQTAQGEQEQISFLPIGG